MKLIKSESDRFTFQISPREKHLLFEILKLYPLINSACYPLSKTTEPKAIEADQQLLEESLAAQRRENKERLLAMLNDAQRFRQHQDGYRFSLDPHQMDWLLQVLNDIRVGSWFTLGCPDEKKGKSIKASERTVTYLWAMELSGLFQMALLDAFGERA